MNFFSVRFKGITAKDAAREIGVPYSTLRYQLKTEFPPLSTFIAIIELAKYPVDEVFGKYDRETAEAVKKLVSLSGEDRKAIFAILKRM